MIIVRQRKILESPIEPRNNKWLWLSNKNNNPVLYTHVSGKWMPLLGASATDNTAISYDEITKTLIIQ